MSLGFLRQRNSANLRTLVQIAGTITGERLLRGLDPTCMLLSRSKMREDLTEFLLDDGDED